MKIHSAYKSRKIFLNWNFEKTTLENSGENSEDAQCWTDFRKKKITSC